MVRTFFTFLIIALLSPLEAQDENDHRIPDIYAFQNGVRFGSVAENIQKLEELGYDGIGSVYPESVPEYLAACKGSDIKLFSTYLGGKVSENDYTYAPNVTTAISALKGTDVFIELYIQRGKGANDEQAILFIREIAKQAEDSGLKVVLYPHFGFYVDTLSDAIRLAKASECKNVGVMFNLCHFLRVEPQSDLEKTIASARGLLWSVSTNGADSEGKDWASLIQPLDQGTFKQERFIKALKKNDYHGPIGLQCYGIKLPSEDHLKRSISAWQEWNKPASLTPDPSQGIR